MKVDKKDEITVVFGDFNSKIGSGAEGDLAEKYGLGEKNTRGDSLVKFCCEHRIFIANTLFKFLLRRLYTWRSPDGREKLTMRNQIDFIIIKSEMRRFIKSMKIFSGADINSDHSRAVMDTLFIALYGTGASSARNACI